MTVNGLEVKVTHKNIKNVHLYVKPPIGNIEVTCPLDYPDENIKMFIRTKIGWIKRKQEEFANQKRQSQREYVSGETFYLWGRQYYLQVVQDPRKYSIAIQGDKIVFSVRNGSTPEQRATFFTEWYRQQLKDELSRLVPKWEKITGLECSSWEIKNMRSQWGSCCYGKRKIILNLQLVKKDIVCVEYVILHELSHFVEKTHNSKFTNFVERYMPNWREIKESLNQQSLAHYE